MKKYLKYLLIFIIIIFILPALCTRRTIETSTELEEPPKQSDEIGDSEESLPTYDYSKYGTIKLYHSKTQEIEELSLDEYLYGVVSAEMPASYEPEALKSQAIVSRTYTLYQIMNGKNKHGEAGICDDSNCCQAWISKEDRLSKWGEDVRESNWNKITKAVNETSGKIITYNGAPIDAFFHSNSGGTTETVSNVWGGTDLPYLQSVQTSGESDYSQYSSEVTLTKDELINKLKEKYPDVEVDFSSEDCIKILEYTDSRQSKNY